MKAIAVYGVTGYVGGHITAEALTRGYDVLGVSRSSEPTPQVGLTVIHGDLSDEGLLRDVASRVTDVVIAVHGAVNGEEYLAPLVPWLLDVASSTNTRLGVVGGAGSLRVSEAGPLLLDTPAFPEAFKAEAKALARVLDLLRQSSSVDWFYVSPAAAFGSYAPGVRTGSYRTGGDVVLADETGASYIGGEDFAIAFVDEIEHPRHVRERFTVAY